MTERPVAAVLTFPLADVPHSGWIMSIELAVAGIGLEVVELPDQLVAVRCSDDNVLLAIVDGDGQRLDLEAGTTGELRFRSVHPSRRPRAGEAWMLEVRIPVGFSARTDDPVDALRQAIGDLLPEASQDLLAHFEPAIRATAKVVGSWNDIPLGASRLNGRPDVPADFEWPRWAGPTTKGAYGEPGAGPLTFLAQINLAELPRLPGDPLPPDGWLLFFADARRSVFLEPEDCAAQRVVYVPGGAALAPRQPPLAEPFYGQGEDGDEGAVGGGAPAALTYEVVTSAPFAALAVAIDGLEGLDDKSRTELDDLVHRCRSQQSWHQLLGQPSPIQDDPVHSAVQTHRIDRSGMSGRAFLAAVREESRRWRVLLQLSCAVDPRRSWDGALWFVIRSEDLAARRFDDTIPDYQR